MPSSDHLCVPFIAKAIRAGIFLLALMPLVLYRPFFYYYASTRALFFFAVVDVMAVALAWVLWVHGWRPRRHPVTVALALFIGLLAVSTVFGANPFLSFWSVPGRMTGLLTYLHMAIALIAMLCVLRQERDWMRFLGLHVAVALVVSLLHFFPALWGEALVQEAGGGSTLGNSSVLGAYLIFMIALAAMLTLAPSSSRPWRVFGSASAVVFLVTLFATDANAAQTAVLGSSALWGVLFWLKRARRPAMKRAALVAGSLLAGIALVASILVFVPSSSVHERFVEIGGPTRFVIWDIALQGIRERPLLGWGLENFSSVFLHHYNPCLNSPACGPGSWADRAHNIVLDTAVTGGLLGLAAYLGVFVAAIVAMWKKRTASWREDALAVTILTTLVASLVQNFTSFDSFMSLWLWIVALAFCVWFTTPIRPDEPRPRKRRIAPVVLTALWLPLALWGFVLEPALGLIGPSRAAAATSVEERLFWYDQAVNRSPVGRDYLRSYMAFETSAALWYATPQTLGDSAYAARDELTIAQAALRETLARNDNDLRAHLMLARAYQVESRLWRAEAIADAQAMLERSIELNPRNPQPLWALTSVLLEQQKSEEALAIATRAFDLNPDDPRAIKLMEVADVLADNTLQPAASQRLQLLTMFY